MRFCKMASETAGARPMAIAGRMVRERERLVGMTDAERAWRAQYLKDQVCVSIFSTVPHVRSLKPMSLLGPIEAGAG